ncbi:MAG: TrkH family potassium uptake protein [Pontiellaceae bacterium]|nr:TrkH family potassium uptake protein [Pontiellaceae bacterium]MBN2784887.1 TrkH family potassium uptake protein [Pontiellaceae bacterium]
MNIRAVFHLVSYMTLVIGLSILGCTLVSYHYHDSLAVQESLLESGGITIACALILWLLTRGSMTLTRRDGFGVVTFGWLIAAIFGALPYMLSGVITHPVPALFETLSGFTTTGASVLGNLEAIPRGIHFWRALTHWFGGMGVLVLCVAILPFLGVGGMQIYRAEVPGPAKDRLTPRITTTAKLLWGVYAMLTLVEALLLKWVGGMTWFDAFCHSFGTIATGGFSTRSDSIGAFNSPVIDGIIIVFMFLSGINFTLHYHALTGKPGRYFRDSEFRLYVGLLLFASAFIALNIWMAGYAAPGRCIRDAVFTATSVMTTTGFCTADFDQWPNASRYLLVILMFAGGCAGSTSGAVKLIRINIIFKKMFREIKLFMRPLSVIQMKYDGRVVENETIAHIAAFIFMYITTFIVAVLLMTLCTPDLETAASSVATTLGGVGPGLSAVGAAHNFSAIPAGGQLVLIACMLLGRLEFYTVFLLFLPGFWKK